MLIIHSKVYFWYRYESETKENIFVTDRSSTYVEFKLKRLESSIYNETLSKLEGIYKKSKEIIGRPPLAVTLTVASSLYIDFIMFLY